MGTCTPVSSRNIPTKRVGLLHSWYGEFQKGLLVSSSSLVGTADEGENQPECSYTDFLYFLFAENLTNSREIILHNGIIYVFAFIFHKYRACNIPTIFQIQIIPEVGKTNFHIGSYICQRQVVLSY
jgi:hypothetical protein